MIRLARMDSRLCRPRREQQLEAARLDAATCLPKPWRRQVEANLRELGYGG